MNPSVNNCYVIYNGSYYTGSNIKHVGFTSTGEGGHINNSYMSAANNSTGSVIAIYTVDEGTITNSLALDNILLNGKFSSTFNGFKYNFFNSNNYIYVTLRYRFNIDYIKTDFEKTIYPYLTNATFKVTFGVGGY